MPDTGIITTYESGVDVVFEWKIETFFNLPERDGAIYCSPTFFFGVKRWWLRILPNGSSGNDSFGHVDLGLWKCFSSLSIEQSFFLYLKTAKGEKYNEQHFSKNFGKTYAENYHELLRFIPRSELTRRRSELVPEGVLTVVCNMKSSTCAGSATRNVHEHAYVGASTQRASASTQLVRASTQRLGASTQRVGASTQRVRASTQSVRASIQHLRASIQRFRASTQCVRTSTQCLGASTQRLGASTQRLEASTQRLGASTQRVGASTQSVRASIQHLRASIQRFRASTQCVRTSTQCLGASTQRLGASTQRLGASTQRLEATTQRLGASTQRVGASTQTLEEKYEAAASGSATNSQEIKALHDFKELFLKKEDCDVTIKVKSSEFLAHRVILKARSPVFASTFRHDMTESATGVLEIDDCDPSSFSDLLCFLYCADVQLITQKSVFDLFTLADKYQVLDLRSKCLEFMKNNLIVDTFCETITLALRHSETDLIKLSTDYFTKNAPKIIVTVKWKTFLAENPTESNELFIKMLVPNSS